MPIALAGVLPVSAINLGLNAALPSLTAKVTKLTADLSKLAPALAGQLKVSATFPPPLPLFAAAITAGLNPAKLSASMGALSFTGPHLNADLVARLGLIQGQLAIVESVVLPLELGLGAGSIAGWSYSGRAAGFGEQLAPATAQGFARTPPNAPVSGVIIATESLASWNAFSQRVHTGATGAPASSTDARLTFLGELGGAGWSSGLLPLKADLDLFLAELQGEQAGLEATIQMSLGLTLPAPDVIVDAGLSIVADLGVAGLLDNMVNVRADITGAIGTIQAQIDGVLALTGAIGGQLSAGGLALWTYSGTASGFGAAFKEAVKNGIPAGSGPAAPAYGIALASTPANMATFGSIFKAS